MGTGARFVFDTTFAREFSLLESQCEFVERYQRHQQDVGALPMLASACPGNPYLIFQLEIVYTPASS